MRRGLGTDAVTTETTGGITWSTIGRSRAPHPHYRGPSHGPASWRAAARDRRSEVSKRSDIFAAALFQGMTVEGLNALDLSYTPPFSSPWTRAMSAQAWGSGRKKADLSAALKVEISQ